MSLADSYINPSKGIGGLAKGIIPKETTIKAVIDFIVKHLPLWANDPNRPQEISENKLNPLLCDFLDVKARVDFPLIRFHHEQPQKGRRQVDLSVKPSEEPGINVSGCDYSIYEPFFVIEGKRLPAPTKQREREYVTGEEDKITGGIQRFKTGAHGSAFDVAAIVGYVQKNNFEYWLNTINGWLIELSESSDKTGICWESNDILKKVFYEKKSV